MLHNIIMKKILIIEDEEILLDVLKKKLSQAGYEIAVARDGEEGLFSMRASRPDLILLDIVMPKKSGLEVLEEMRSDKNLQDISVIVISNSGQPVEIDQVLKLGVKDYLVKTQFDPQEVLSKVKQQLDEEGGETKLAKAGGNDLGDGIILAAANGIVNSALPASEAISRRRKILIVEDDKFLRELIVRKLETEGFESLAAVDGQEGLNMVETQKPDLVILDLILPGLDGFEVLRRIKEDLGFVNLPVVILSNLGQREDVERGLNLGANDFLIKAHFTLGEVIDKVKSHLK